MGRLCAFCEGARAGGQRKRVCGGCGALGATDLRILARHILPNIIQPVIVQAAIGMAGAIARSHDEFSAGRTA